MGYPQPDANKYSTGGAGFFRLNTTLSSDGDIYQSEQGAHGLAIGPDSDVDKVIVAYFDPQVDQQMSQVAVSPDRPFPGFIQAANESGLYVPANRPGRILFWPDAIFNPNWVPGNDDTLVNDPAVRIDIEVPTIDVVEYFAPGPATAGRNDKRYYLQNLPIPNAGGVVAPVFFFYNVPFYGRRYACVKYRPNVVSGTAKITAFGVTYRMSDDPANSSLETTVIAEAAVTNLTVFEDEILASADGMYDAIYVKLEYSAKPPAGFGGELEIIVSDQE